MLLFLNINLYRACRFGARRDGLGASRYPTGQLGVDMIEWNGMNVVGLDATRYGGSGGYTWSDIKKIYFIDLQWRLVKPPPQLMKVIPESLQWRFMKHHRRDGGGS